MRPKAAIASAPGRSLAREYWRRLGARTAQALGSRVKLAAATSMVIDHTNIIVLAHSQPWMWALGRFAFPAFCILAGLGARRTRDAAAYVRRLLACAAVSQPLHWWVFGLGLIPLNICFTLALGVVSVVAWRERHWPVWAVVWPLSLATTGSWWGVALVWVAGVWPLSSSEAVYDTRPPGWSRAAFYVFYPAHLAVLGGLAAWGVGA